MKHLKEETLKTELMKHNELIIRLEDQRSLISRSKATMMLIQRDKFSKTLGASLDLAINSLSKMIIESYKEIGYEVSYEEYSDDNPLYRMPIDLRPGYNPDTQISIAVGLINNALTGLKSLDKKSHERVINKADNSTVKTTSKYFTKQKDAVKGLSEAIDIISGAPAKKKKSPVKKKAPAKKKEVVKAPVKKKAAIKKKSPAKKKKKK